MKKSKKKGGKLNLKNEYIKSWEYIKDSQKFIWLVTAFFFFTAILGFIIEPPESLSIKIFQLINELLEKTENLSHGGLIKFIFLNNIQSSFTGMILGFLFGIFPLISTIANGYLVGFVSRFVVDAQGFSSLWRLVPHGIFELPAVFISLGLGLKFGTFMFHKNKSETFREFFWNSLRVFITVILPLLIIAAIIEGTLIFLTK